MKVCFVAVSLDRAAGLGRMVTSIAEGLRERGDDVGYVFENGESTNNELRINFTGILRTPVTFIKDLLRLRRYLRQYDVVVCFDVKPAGIFTHVACMGLQKNIVVHVLGTYSLFDPKNKWKNFLIKYVFNHSIRLFFVSEFVRKKIETSKPGFKFNDNWSYLSVGVNVDLFTKTVEAKPMVLKPYIISVGAIKERKSQLLSLKSFHLVHSSHPELKYVICGSQTNRPTYVEKLKDYVSRHNLEASIVFLEHVTDDELINLYRHALFFVMTPISTEYYIEGFGMVYLESALAGITSVGTLDSGAEAAIVDNRTGLLAEHDVNDVAQKMKQLVENHELRNKLAKEASVRARQFTWEAVIHLYVKELSNLK